jgi:hypothetical protein
MSGNEIRVGFRKVLLPRGCPLVNDALCLNERANRVICDCEAFPRFLSLCAAKRNLTQGHQPLQIVNHQCENPVSFGPDAVL